MLDPKKVTESRKAEREVMGSEPRQLRALEQIADTLECIRGELAGISHALERSGRLGPDQ